MRAGCVVPLAGLLIAAHFGAAEGGDRPGPDRIFCLFDALQRSGTLFDDSVALAGLDGGADLVLTDEMHDESVFPPEFLGSPDEVFEQVQQLEPLRPALNPTLVPSPQAANTGTGLGASIFDPGGAAPGALAENRRRAASTDVISGREGPARVTTDAGSLLSKSPSARGVTSQRRTPIVTDPRVRGNKSGPLLASGSYWVPARLDLDTMLSKIDSRVIREVNVIRGPYSTLYGPGFSVIDVQLLEAPRYENGQEVHATYNTDFQSNGRQLYGRQTYYGGDKDWGFRVGYGYRTGNDYETGAGYDIPSSYKSGDADLAVGWDPTDDSHLEFSYLRLDQSDVEYPGQIFDMDYLKTDAFETTYILEDQPYFDRFRVEGWYNQTLFAGNAQNNGKRKQIPQLDFPLMYTGNTNVESLSTGYSAAASWGDLQEPALTVGTDLRYVVQELNEFSSYTVPNPDGMPSSARFDGLNSPIPRSEYVDPGVFAQLEIPIEDDWLVRTGLRADWVSTDILDRPTARRRDPTGIIPNSDFTDDRYRMVLGADRLGQEWPLYAGFLNGTYQLTDEWQLNGGVGYAERAPNLTELYALNPFLAILQQGFTAVLGNPNLEKEKLIQVDIGAEVDYGRLRAGASGFYASVHDYITFTPNAPQGALPAIQTVYANTPWATLDGGEAHAEFDATPWLTSFCVVSYVEGRDRARDQRPALPGMTVGVDEPLPGIAPLESRLGVRWHDPSPDARWTIEFSARVVDDQTRVATSLLERPTAGFTTYDIRTQWQVTKQWQIVSGIENISDKFYREHLDLRTGNGVFQPGRSYYVGTQVSF